MAVVKFDIAKVSNRECVSSSSYRLAASIWDELRLIFFNLSQNLKFWLLYYFSSHYSSEAKLAHVYAFVIQIN